MKLPKGYQLKRVVRVDGTSYLTVVVTRWGATWALLHLAWNHPSRWLPAIKAWYREITRPNEP